jgi:hypothetical protein
MEIDPQIINRKMWRLAFLGILLIALGVVFIKSGRLGTVFILAGAVLIIIALIRRNS